MDKKSLDRAMVDITINCMLNPNNKDFYIGTLTKEKREKFLRNLDVESSIIFKTAYQLAYNIYTTQQKNKNI